MKKYRNFVRTLLLRIPVVSGLLTSQQSHIFKLVLVTYIAVACILIAIYLQKIENT